VLNNFFKKDDTLEKKKSTSKANMVFGLGVILILIMLFFFFRNMYLTEVIENKPLQTMKKTQPIEEVKKHTAPFAMYVKPSHPVKEKIPIKKPIELLNVKNIKPVKNNMQILQKEKILHVIKSAKSETIYACTLFQKYLDIQGKEIIYYVRNNLKNDSHYTPVHKLKSWNERGIIIKERFIVINLDKKFNMAEISTNKWIPALKFASCTQIKGNN